MTYSSSSFSLTMVTPTSHFFAFHWLCCLLPIGYFPKPSSVGVRICHYHQIQPRPQVKVIFRYLRPDAPVSTSTVFTATCGHGDILAITLLILFLSGCSCLNIHWYTAPVDMTFRWSRRSYQSICQQHPAYSHPQVTLIYYIISTETQTYLCCDDSVNCRYTFKREVCLTVQNIKYPLKWIYILFYCINLEGYCSAK